MNAPAGQVADADIEMLIVDCVQDLLDVDEVDLDSFFLDLGGDSLLGTILANRIEDEFAFRPCLEDIFELSFAQIVQRIQVEAVRTN